LPKSRPPGDVQSDRLGKHSVFFRWSENQVSAFALNEKSTRQLHFSAGDIPPGQAQDPLIMPQRQSSLAATDAGQTPADKLNLHRVRLSQKCR
jgi:hypothetical protein